jgi:NAD(P)-dependent dehydrogenase (short-subunit alcohol dehydrogenase family)
MNLRGKTALVTGGAHRVGRSIVLALAEQGCDVMVHFHQAEPAARQTVRDALDRGVKAHAIRADLRTRSGIDDLFGETDRIAGGLDVLVNSAAVLEPVELLAATDADWASTIDLNLKAAFFCLQAAARRMQERGGGAIVNISDVAGRRPWAHYTIHSISKAGVDMLTRSAALALAPAIRVNGVAPGPVEKPARLSDERWREIAGHLPLRRPGTAAELPIVFLSCQRLPRRRNDRCRWWRCDSLRPRVNSRMHAAGPWRSVPWSQRDLSRRELAPRPWKPEAGHR